MIEFNKRLHQYSRHGAVIPSVTQVMSGLLVDYSAVPADVLAHAADRGTAVHKAVELYHQDDLDEASLDPEVAPYFYQYLAWVKSGGFMLEHSELLVHSEKYGYAGTLDLAGTIGRKAVIIDIKTSRQVMPSVGPQLAAYETAFKESTGDKRKFSRFALHLTPESYTLVPKKDPADMRIFLSALTIHNWRKQWKM